MSDCETIVLVGLIMVLLTFAFHQEKFRNNPVNQEIQKINNERNSKWYAEYTKNRNMIEEKIKKKNAISQRDLSNNAPKLPQWLYPDFLVSETQRQKFNVFPHTDPKHTSAKPPLSYKPSTTDKGKIVI